MESGYLVRKRNLHRRVVTGNPHAECGCAIRTRKHIAQFRTDPAREIRDEKYISGIGMWHSDAKSGSKLQNGTWNFEQESRTRNLDAKCGCAI